MEEQLYWITRLDPLLTCITTILVLSAVTVAAGLAGSIYIESEWSETLNYELKRMSSEEVEKLAQYKAYMKWRAFWRRAFEIGLLLTITFTVLKIMVPSTKDALLIRGVGTSIDYLRNNQAAQELPDKCIDALSRWVDSFAVEEKEKVEE